MCKVDTARRISAVACFIAAGSAAAQIEPASLMLQDLPYREDAIRDDAAGSPVTIVLDVHPRLTFRSDLNGSDADVLVSHNGFGVTISGMVNPDLRLTLNLGGEISYYDWDGSNSVFPGDSDPFEDMYSARVILAARQRVSGPWHAVFGGIGRAQGESDADFSDSLTGGGFLAAGYDIAERAWIDFGVAVFSRLEDDPLVVPYLNFRIPINETVRVEADGLGLGVVAAISDQLEFAVRGEVEFRDYRLDDSRPAWRNGIVEDLRVPVGVELAWMPAPGLTIAVEGGAVVYQEFEFLDSSGHKLSDVETDPAAYVGLRVKYRF